MIDTCDRDLSCSDLEYLLLDDLYEMLETPLDEDTRQAVVTIVTFLLSLEHERERGEVPELILSRHEGVRTSSAIELERCRHGLYAHLVDLQTELIADCCSRSTVEGTRDAVLVWIHRLQRHQRRMVRETAAQQMAGVPGDLDCQGSDGNADQVVTNDSNAVCRADFVFEYKPGRYF
jgi:hypothetical protein